MEIREAIATVSRGQHLTQAQATAVMDGLMEGTATPAQIAALLTALHMKGEQEAEIAGMAASMQTHALPVPYYGELVDTCGTGGDGLHTFNISTTAAFVVAGAGATVAKHGNRAMSSKAGSADVLEALGVKIDLSPDGVARCLHEVGIAFMFAQTFHPAMRYVAPVRRELGIRTVFNVLGPLSNPARARYQIVGVANPTLAEKLANAFSLMPIEHALIVHGADGMDELSLSGENLMYDVRPGATPRRVTLAATTLGFAPAHPDALRGGTATENATITHAILDGRDQSARRDIVLLNAAAALVAADQVPDLPAGIELARISLDSGQALTRLQQLIVTSNAPDTPQSPVNTAPPTPTPRQRA